MAFLNARLERVARDLLRPSFAASRLLTVAVAAPRFCSVPGCIAAACAEPTAAAGGVCLRAPAARCLTAPIAGAIASRGDGGFAASPPAPAGGAAPSAFCAFGAGCAPGLRGGQPQRAPQRLFRRWQRRRWPRLTPLMFPREPRALVHLEQVAGPFAPGAAPPMRAAAAATGARPCRPRNAWQCGRWHQSLSGRGAGASGLAAEGGAGAGNIGAGAGGAMTAAGAAAAGEATDVRAETVSRATNAAAP